jgi:hypothetical protein
MDKKPRVNGVFFDGVTAKKFEKIARWLLKMLKEAGF